MEAVGAHLLGHQPGLLLHVAGQQLDGTHSVVSKGVDGPAHVLPGMIHGAQHGQQPVIQRHIIGDDRPRRGQGGGNAYAALLHVLQAAHPHGVSVHHGAAAPGYLGDDVGMGRDRDALLAAKGEDGAAQGVGAGLLCRHGIAQNVRLRHVRREIGVGHDGGLALGDGAGLVQQHGVG